jgi:phosphatidylinositol phospholipase C epsilon
MRATSSSLQPLPLSSLFLCSTFHPDSPGPTGGSMEGPHPDTLHRKRMSFLVVHDISDSNPYAILKVTNDSTTQDVIKMALEKTGKVHKANEFVLVEEVDDETLQAGFSKRMVGMEEIPLSLREEWGTHGKFVLKKVGDDPSWRARLCVSDRDRKASMMVRAESVDVPEEAEAKEQDVRDDFMVCVYNISPTVAHTIFTTSKVSTTKDVIRHCLERGRREDQDPGNFVLMEEQEVKDGKGKKGKRTDRRILRPDENVYLVQSR